MGKKRPPYSFTRCCGNVEFSQLSFIVFITTIATLLCKIVKLCIGALIALWDLVTDGFGLFMHRLDLVDYLCYVSTTPPNTNNYYNPIIKIFSNIWFSLFCFADSGGGRDMRRRTRSNNNIGSDAQEQEQMPPSLGNRNKEERVEDRPGSKQAKESSGHHNPSAKQQKVGFLHQYLITKKDLPLLDQSSDKTPKLAALTNIVQKLKNVAAKITNGEFCPADSNSTTIKDIELLIIGHFPPSGSMLHLYGILSTWMIQDRSKVKESRNIPPVNCSIHEFFRTFANIMSIEYGVDFLVALKICIQISAWVDILPVTLPYDSADDKSKRSLYTRTRKKTDHLSKEYIEGLIRSLSHLKCIIVVGDEPYKFVQEMKKAGMIPEHVKIFQHSPIIHPTKLLKWGASKREAYWFYDCITKTLAHLVNANQSEPELRMALQDKVRYVFPDRQPDSVTGCFVYKAYVGNTVLFITRGYEELTELIRSYKNGSIPDSFNNEDILNSGSRYLFRGLELELIWFDQHDYSEDFGVLDEAGMKQWVMKAKKIRDKSWVLKQDTTISNTGGGGHLTSATENVNWFTSNVMRRRR